MFGARRPTTEERAIQATAWGDWGESGINGTHSGTHVTTGSALQLLAVYGCNRFICEGISTLPVDVFREAGDGTRQEAPSPRWLDRPTHDLDRISWLTQILTSLLLDGNAYLWLEFDGTPGGPSQVIPLAPSKVTVRRPKAGGPKEYFVAGKLAPEGTILHIPGVMIPGSDVGLSPVEAARQAIGSGLATEEFAARFFGQGANLSGVIEDPGPIDDGKARMMARTWARLHSGNAKSHLPGVLQGGAQWKPTGVTNEQSQFLESRQFTASQIASHMFLIDPTEFGFSGDKGSSLTYANLEQRNARKVQVTFLPWIVRLELALSSLMAKPRFLKFNVNGLLRGDTKTRFETYQIASTINTAAAAVGEPPVLTTREMREFEDLVPYEGDVPTPLPVAAGDAPTGPSAPPAT